MGEWQQNQNQDIVRGKGFQDVKVTAKVTANGPFIFEVEYYDKIGEFQKNSCVMDASLFSEGKIYWEKPVE